MSLTKLKYESYPPKISNVNPNNHNEKLDTKIPFSI